MVVGYVVVEEPLGLVFVLEDDIAEAAPPERAAVPIPSLPGLVADLNRTSTAGRDHCSFGPSSM